MKRDKTAREIATMYDVQRRTITNWVSDGCPNESRDGKLWFSDNEVAKWMESKGITGEPGRKKSKSSKEQEFWKTSLIKSKARMADLELKRMRGDLLDAKAEQLRDVKKIFELKNELLKLPTIAASITGLEAHEAEAKIKERVVLILEKFSTGYDTGEIDQRINLDDSGAPSVPATASNHTV